MKGLSLQNRSLARGIAILRAFRPGTALLGNGEIAERTGLPRSSISRLTQTLTCNGYLEYCAPQRAYRLGAAVLTLAHAMRMSSPVLRIATPAMQTLARRMRINVGLAARDESEMVYLESVRFDLKSSQRSVTPGQRVPIELTALGRAWLAAAPETERQAVMAHLGLKRRKNRRVLNSQIADAMNSVRRHGYCVAFWQPQVVALAAPLIAQHYPIYVVNVSVTTDEPRDSVVRRLEQPLLELAAHLQRHMEATDL